MFKMHIPLKISFFCLFGAVFFLKTCNTMNKLSHPQLPSYLYYEV